MQAWVGQNVLECNVLRASVLNAPIRDAMLAAEATPWLQPLSHNVAVALGHVMRLRFKAGRALDAQEAGPDLF